MCGWALSTELSPGHSAPAGKQVRNYTAGPAVLDTCSLKILASGDDNRHGMYVSSLPSVFGSRYHHTPAPISILIYAEYNSLTAAEQSNIFSHSPIAIIPDTSI